MITTLLLGLIPFALLGAVAVYRNLPAPAAMTGAAETEASRLLADAGLPWARLRLDDRIGHLTGIAPDAASAAAALGKAREALKPLTGMFGVFEVIRNETTASASPEAPAAAVPATEQPVAAPEHKSTN